VARWLRRLSLVWIAAVAGLTGQAEATTLFGLTGDGLRVLEFDSTAPQTIVRAVGITGLGAGERLAGIDVRPATGELYGLGVVTGGSDAIRLYRIDPRTGIATPLGTGLTVGTASAYGVDFNPVSDRFRVVNSGGANLRLNPNNGALSGMDVSISMGVVAVAYDRNTAGATLTTVFAIDSAADRLVRIGGVDGNPSPNLGAVTTIGLLGVSPVGDAGFDIDVAGTAYAALTVGGQTGLYTVALGTGTATLVGPIGDGTTPLAGLSATSDMRVVISPATGTYATAQSFDLVLFVDAPGRTITGAVVTFDGVDVTAALLGCLKIGFQMPSAGLAVRCPGLSGALLTAGVHTLAATVTFSGGGISGTATPSATASVTYTIVPTVEP
jgi:hypothetical protein